VKVERAVLRELPLELREPFAASHGVVRHRRVLLLTLRGEGLEGWSECVALAEPTYTYETTDTAWRLLTEVLLPGVVGHPFADPRAVLDPVDWVRGHPMARAAVEMAAWDMAARADGVSLASKLGGTRGAVPVGVSVGLEPTDQRLEDTISRHLADGYRRVKIKISPGRDVEMLARVREKFGSVSLSADANSAYTLADLPRLRELDRIGLEMIEQPLAPDDLLGHAELQREIETPVCLDESVCSVTDARLALHLSACLVLNLKPGRVGGHAAARQIHDLMRAADVPVWCGGMLESGVGRAHNVALASLPGFTLPGDLSASRRYWVRDIVDPEFEVVDGEMVVPAGPGIGVTVDADRVASLTVREAVFG